MPCLVCGEPSATKEIAPNSFTFYRCKNGHSFGAADELIVCNSEKQNLYFNMISEFLIHHPRSENNRYWYFYYNPEYMRKDSDKPAYINLAQHENSYPDTFIEKVNRSLINLSILFPSFGDDIDDDFLVRRATYCKDFKSDDETHEFLKHIHELGYLNSTNGHIFQFSSAGWIKIDELQKASRRNKQGFLAMRFGDKTKDIREAIRTAIRISGYDMMVIDEKEHNNQIVPEILFEIKNSTFLVVDITHPSYGAYYEAGYAQGCGIEVIVCCKKEVLDNPNPSPDRPHFDISQKNMVPWEDLEDLQKRLIKRINATVNLKS